MPHVNHEKVLNMTFGALEAGILNVNVHKC